MKCDLKELAVWSMKLEMAKYDQLRPSQCSTRFLPRIFLNYRMSGGQLLYEKYTNAKIRIQSAGLFISFSRHNSLFLTLLRCVYMSLWQS